MTILICVDNFKYLPLIFIPVSVLIFLVSSLSWIFLNIWLQFLNFWSLSPSWLGHLYLNLSKHVFFYFSAHFCHHLIAQLMSYSRPVLMIDHVLNFLGDCIVSQPNSSNYYILVLHMQSYYKPGYDNWVIQFLHSAFACICAHWMLIRLFSLKSENSMCIHYCLSLTIIQAYGSKLLLWYHNFFFLSRMLWKWTLFFKPPVKNFSSI
jgi:hypothetical protein